jgi:hypothetical protein
MAEPTSKMHALFPIIKARATATVDVASLVDAAGATQSITCTGAALGDFVLVSHSLDVQDITVTAYVQSANTVEVRFQNEGAATVDLGSGTVTVLVIDKDSGVSTPF